MVMDPIFSGAEPRARSKGPASWRIVLAFLTVPALAAISMALIVPMYDGLPSEFERIFATAKVYGLLGTYPTALIFGVPTYLLLRRLVEARAWVCAAVGSGVAMAPWLLFALLPGADTASIDGDV